MFMVSFATNLYFYIENQELLHNLAYKEIHETLKIEECKKLLALQDKKFHEQINDNLMKHRSEGLYSNLKLSDSVGFNPAHDQPPAMVKGMPPVNHKYVPNPQINAAPMMVGNQEEFNNHLEEPEEDFQNDFNYDDKGDHYYDPHGANNYRASDFNNRIQLNEPEVAPEVPAPVVNAVPNAALEHIEHQEEIFEKNLEQQHLIAEEQKQLTDSLRDVLELINSRGADKFAEELMAKGADDIAQTVEEFSQAEADPAQEFEGDLDVAELQDIKSEVDDFIAENPQYEAEPAAEKNDFEFENQEEQADNGLGNDPLSENDSFGAPIENKEEMNFGFESDNGDVDSDSDNFDQEPAGFEGEPAGFGGEPEGFDQEPAFDEDQPVEPDMNYGDQEANDQDGQDDPLGNEFPEIEPESDSFGGNEDDQGFDLNANQVSDSEINVEGESLNLERPIGDQELQSQRAESLQTGEAILNQNLDNFLPQMARGFGSPETQSHTEYEAVQPVADFNDVNLAEDDINEPVAASNIQSDPLKPIVDIHDGGTQFFGNQGRLDQSDDFEPAYDNNYNNQYNNYMYGNQMGNMNRFGQMGMVQKFPRLGMNGHGQQWNQMQNPQNIQKQADSDPDEKIAVVPINLPDLGPNQFPKDCNQLYNYGQRRSAIYQISPDGTNVIKARCDFSNSGGWTVIQYRHDGSLDFYRNYHNYTIGFGDPASEHWLGLENIHQLTYGKQSVRVKVELTDFNDHSEFAEHEDFYVYGADQGYKANIGIKRHGELSSDNFSLIKGERFTTFDNDQDTWKEGNCASDLHSAGWFSRCTYFNANGRYYHTGIDTANKRDGIYWAKYPVNLRPVDPSNRSKRVGSYYWTMKSTKISILVNPNQK